MTTMRMTAVSGHGPLRGLGHLLRQPLARLAARLDASATTKELQSLNDHLLRDVGLERDEVHRTAWHAARSLYGLR